MKANNINIKDLGIFIFFVFCFVISPGLLIFFGFQNNELSTNESLVQSYKTKINRFFKELIVAGNQEVFWCNYISEKLTPLAFKNSKEIQRKELENIAFEIQKEAQLPHIILDTKSNILKATFKIINKTDYIKALKVFHHWFYAKSASIFSENEFSIIGRIFGPQYALNQLNNSSDGTGRLFWTDSKGKKPPLYVRAFGKFLIVFFIKSPLLESRKGLDIKITKFIRNFPIPLNYAYISRSGFQFGKQISKSEKSELISSSKEAIKLKKTLFFSKRFISFTSFIKPNLEICLFINKNYVHSFTSKYIFFLFLIYSIASYLILAYLWKLIVLKQSNFIPIKWLLRILFVFANGLPLVVLFYIGSNFLSQERGNLLEQKLREGTDFLQNFDRTYESIFAKKILLIKKATSYLSKVLENKPINQDIANTFLKIIGNISSVNLIASKSSALITSSGLIDVKRGIYPPLYKNKRRRKKMKIKNQAILRIGKFFLSMLNKTRINTKDSTEIEIMIESFSQKPLVNFLQLILSSRGKIVPFGFGDANDPTFMDALHFGMPPAFQYFIVGIWKADRLQNEFLQKNIIKANRNDIGIEVIAINKDNVQHVHPDGADISSSLLSFNNMLTTYPSDEVKFVIHKNKKYLAMGFIANKLSDFRLVGLFPVNAINDEISKQKRNLIIFALLSLLTTFTISQLLARSFLVPLNHLGGGAKAIEENNFAHRLPNLGIDEFGRMGKIFNNVMVDLDELSVAGTIQEQLLPQGPIPTGKFSLYGKSVSMSQLGGDYFDYMTVSENSFGLLLGDVAGHGVGASLIMAMAKAAMVQSVDLLASPKELIIKLHKLIHASRTKKQRKIMTFQYLYVNQDTGKALYSNAGACSPILVDFKKQTTEELTLAGPALGAFKRAKYSEIELTIEPGNAVVFYTDGIVESRNKDGKEIGYDDMKEMFLKCWSNNAEEYYLNIFNAYLAHIGDEPPEDDLTMVVLVNPSIEN